MVVRVAFRVLVASAFVMSALAVMGHTSRTAMAAERASPSWPAQVRAVYKISLSGFDLGTFQLKSKVDGGRYILDGDAELSALLGAFSWRGITRSSGRMLRGKPRPEGYVFNFRSNEKVGMIGMSFSKAGVKTVSMVPKIPTFRGEVPVKPHHLKKVFDPLTAVMAIAAGGTKGQPCSAKIPVFDGKQRFDLELSFRRREQASEWRTSDQPKVLYVCGIRYRPVAGFKPNKSTKTMAESNGIEIAVRPVSGASIFIPHRITIPTIAGNAVLEAQKVEVFGSGAVAGWRKRAGISR